MKKYEAASGQGWDGGMIATGGGNGSNDLLLCMHGEENVGGIGSMQDGRRGDWTPIAQNDGLQGKDEDGGEGRLVAHSYRASREGGPSG